MKTKVLLVFCILTAALFSASARALPNPFPGVVEDDDFAELFVPLGVSLNVELANPLNAAFGFLYLDGPDPIVPVFLPGSGLGPSAFVDFAQGIIVDLVTQQARPFAARPGPIAFYFAFPPGGDGSPGLFLSTLNSLNSGGADLVGTYASQDLAGSYLIIPFLPTDTGPVPLEITLVTNVAPAPIPEPSAIGCLLLGLGVLLPLWNRSRSKLAA
jgi:hypothetical protein